MLNHSITGLARLHVREHPVEVRIRRGALAGLDRVRPDLDRDAVAGRVLADHTRRPADALSAALEQDAAGEDRGELGVRLADRDLHGDALQRVRRLVGHADGPVRGLLGDLVAVLVFRREGHADERRRGVAVKVAGQQVARAVQPGHSKSDALD